jgi:hypothetical protein
MCIYFLTADRQSQVMKSIVNVNFFQNTELMTYHCIIMHISKKKNNNKNKPEALKSLYRSSGYKKTQLVLCKNYVLQW